MMKKKLIKPSPNEEMRLIKDKLEEKKRFRLLQVREQSKHCSSALNSKFKQEKEKCFQDIITQLKEEFDDEIACKESVLIEQLNRQVKKMGEGHKIQGKENYGIQQQISEHALKKIDVRYELALKQVLADRKNKENIQKQQLELKKKVKDMEDFRKNFIISLPVLDDDPISKLKTSHPVLKKNSDTLEKFSKTHFHLQFSADDEFPDVVVEKVEKGETKNAILSAQDEQVRLISTKHHITNKEKERLKKAETRHQIAKQKLLLEKQNKLLLENLGDLEMKDRQRRKHLVSKISTKIYQSEAQMLADGRKKQFELEQMFEKIYNARDADDARNDMQLPQDKSVSEDGYVIEEKQNSDNHNKEASNEINQLIQSPAVSISVEDGQTNMKSGNRSTQGEKLSQFKQHLLKRRGHSNSESKPGSLSVSSHGIFSNKESLRSMNIESACESTSNQNEKNKIDMRWSPGICNESQSSENTIEHAKDLVDDSSLCSSKPHFNIIVPQIDDSLSHSGTTSDISSNAHSLNLTKSEPVDESGQNSENDLESEKETIATSKDESNSHDFEHLLQIDNKTKTATEADTSHKNLAQDHVETQTQCDVHVGIQTSFAYSEDSLGDSLLHEPNNFQLSENVRTEDSTLDKSKNKSLSDISSSMIENDTDRLKYHREIIKKQRQRLQEQREKSKIKLKSMLDTAELQKLSSNNFQDSRNDIDAIPSWQQSFNSISSVEPALSELNQLSNLYSTNNSLQINMQPNSLQSSVCDPFVQENEIGKAFQQRQTNVDLPVDEHILFKENSYLKHEIFEEELINKTNHFSNVSSMEQQDNVINENGNRFFRVAEIPQVSPIKEVDEEIVDNRGDASLEEQSLSINSHIETIDFTNFDVKQDENGSPRHEVFRENTIDKEPVYMKDHKDSITNDFIKTAIDGTLHKQSNLLESSKKLISNKTNQTLNDKNFFRLNALDVSNSNLSDSQNSFQTDVDDTSNVSVPSLSSTSLSAFEDLLQRIRLLPLKHQQEQKAIVESFHKEQKDIVDSFHKEKDQSSSNIQELLAKSNTSLQDSSFHQPLSVNRSVQYSQTANLSEYDAEKKFEFDAEKYETKILTEERRRLSSPESLLAKESPGKIHNRKNIQSGNHPQSHSFQISTPYIEGNQPHRKKHFLSSLSSVENMSLKAAQPIFFEKSSSSQSSSEESCVKSSDIVNGYMISYFEDVQPEYTLYKNNEESSMKNNSLFSSVQDSYIPLPAMTTKDKLSVKETNKLSAFRKINPVNESKFVTTTGKNEHRGIETSSFSQSLSSAKKTSDNISSLVTDSKTEDKEIITLDDSSKLQSYQQPDSVHTSALIEQQLSDSRNILSEIDNTKLAIEILEMQSQSTLSSLSAHLSEQSMGSSNSSELFTVGRLSLQGNQSIPAQTELSLLSDLDFSSMSSSEVNWTTLHPTSMNTDELHPPSEKPTSINTNELHMNAEKPSADTLQQAFSKHKKQFIEMSKARAKQKQEKSQINNISNNVVDIEQSRQENHESIEKEHEKSKRVTINIVPEILNKEKLKAKHQESRQRTKNLYMRLPEVQQRLAEKERQKQRQINREKAQVFHEKLKLHMKKKSASS